MTKKPLPIIDSGEAFLFVGLPDQFRGGGGLRGGREGRFERFPPGGDGVVKLDDVIIVDLDDGFVDGLAERNGSGQFAVEFGGEFEDDGTVGRDEEVAHVGLGQHDGNHDPAGT